ncbi:Dyp-type peroxidase [Planomonospora parontospora]|uniref:Dyp-type peroxidase n=1 Tax=Planomonospora parontospora TaxID=58119 RepID=UPI001785A133|nr:Dyp-type peroxidase domain-containing protein [Planomonospora parontospora]
MTARITVRTRTPARTTSDHRPPSHPAGTARRRRRGGGGRPGGALAGTEPELAASPARLTVTFGFGPGLFTAAGAGHLRPEAVAPLPAFPIDKLERRWNRGDLLLQICADDALTVTHALRMTVKDARSEVCKPSRQNSHVLSE